MTNNLRTSIFEFTTADEQMLASFAKSTSQTLPASVQAASMESAAKEYSHHAAAPKFN